ncbi:hypothetical protein JCM11491_003097 [Sporobolomyces phaffii]
MSSLQRSMFSPGKEQHPQHAGATPVTPEPAGRPSTPNPHHRPALHSRSTSRSKRAQSSRPTSPRREDDGHLVSIRDLLFRPLLEPPAKISEAKPAVNKAAQKQGLDTRHVRVVGLPAFDTPGSLDQAHFLDFIESDRAPKVPNFPQMTRYHAREADVAYVRSLTSEPICSTTEAVGAIRDSGSYLTNVVNPAVAILQTMIDRRYHRLLKIVVAAQYEAFPEDVEDGQSNSKLDDIITLQKWPLTRAEIQSGTPTFKKILFIIEYKRPGYIEDEDWKARHLETLDSRARRLLAQLILYARNFACESFVFSDYKTSIAVKVDVEEALDAHATIDVAAVDCKSLVEHDRHLAHAANPILALVWTGVVALDKLGILRRDIRGDEPGERPLHPHLRDYLGPHLLVTGEAERLPVIETPRSKRSSSGSGGVVRTWAPSLNVPSFSPRAKSDC